MTRFLYADDNKRYHTLAYHYKQNGIKTQKAIVDIGCTCPNADGTKGVGGCRFCDGSASYFAQTRLAKSTLSVTEQLVREQARIHAKWPGASLTAYFQSGTNTYLPVEKLKDYLKEAAAFPNVASVSIATRPDCISSEMLRMLSGFACCLDLTIELGLQTVNDDVAALMNRCYPYSVFLDCFRRLRRENIRICVHLINGLPGENLLDMIHSAAVVGALRPDGIKIQLLHVLKDTALANWYARGAYTPMTFHSYVETVAAQLEHIPAEVVIERLTGDGDRSRLLAPLWSRDKLRVLGSIDQKMAELCTFQGSKEKI